MMGMIFFSRSLIFFLAKRAAERGTAAVGGAGTKGFRCAKSVLLPLLHLQNEEGIETNPFPPFALRLPALHPPPTSPQGGDNSLRIMKCDNPLLYF
jgi:hypothetical protein